MNKCQLLPTIESQIIAFLLFEQSPVDIESLIVKNNVDITRIIPSIGTSILHLIGQNANYRAALLLESLIASRYFHVDNIDNIDNYGMTLLHYAIQNESNYIVDLLIECEANPNIQNHTGNTPLHIAAYTCNPGAVMSLLSLKSIDTSIKNIDSLTARNLAEHNGEVEIVGLLSKKSGKKEDEVIFYDADELNTELSKIQPDSPDGSYEVTIRHLSNMSPNLMIDTLKGDEIANLESLKHKFPNFIGIIDFIIGELSLMSVAKFPFKSFRPILMHGAPGVGKTRFVTELANIMSLPLCRIDGGAVSSGYSISGINASYKNAKMGAIANFMIEADYANGLVFIDEVDKLSDSDTSSQFAPLHSLLVAETAEKFKDDFLNVSMNCSCLNWIGTANIMSRIPKSIQSRFQIFEIQPPTKEQVKVIISSILDDIRTDKSKSWSEVFDLRLPEDLINELTSLPVRELRDIIIGGLANAARIYQKQNHSNLKLKKIKLKKEHFQFSKFSEKSKIGFLA